jgi:hypothetical protein
MYHESPYGASFARVVKLVDTRDLKSLAGNSVPVQVRPWAPLFVLTKLSVTYIYILYRYLILPV